MALINQRGIHKKCEQLPFILIYYLLGIIFRLAWGLGIERWRGGGMRRWWEGKGGRTTGVWRQLARETQGDKKDRRDNVINVFDVM